MTTTIGILGSVQKIPETTIAGSSVVIGTTLVTLYTVPAGKKAKVINASERLISLGANTLTRVLFANRRYTQKTVVETMLAQIAAALNIVLLAGETIQLQGDNAANNGSDDFSFTLQEVPT